MIHNGIEYTQIPYAPTYYISRCCKVVSIRSGKVKDISIRTNKSGYLVCHIISNGKKTPVAIHKLLANAFLGNHSNSYMVHINHIDGNKLNNNISNLEAVSLAENQRHYHINTNTLGLGVAYYRRRNKYTAQIHYQGQKKHIGYYDTPEQAHKAYIDAFIRYGFKDKYVEQLPAYKEAIAIRGEGVAVL